jgi:hypothetical protein
MTKVVINKRYGGFGLSDEAFIEWCRRKNYQVAILDPEWPSYWAVPTAPFSDTPAIVETLPDESFYTGDISRGDADLVAIVEEWAGRADGQYSSLKVVEIPDDVEWEIEEYDGREWIAEAHRTWS